MLLLFCKIRIFLIIWSIVIIVIGRITTTIIIMWKLRYPWCCIICEWYFKWIIIIIRFIFLIWSWIIIIIVISCKWEVIGFWCKLGSIIFITTIYILKWLNNKRIKGREWKLVELLKSKFERCWKGLKKTKKGCEKD